MTAYVGAGLLQCVDKAAQVQPVLILPDQLGQVFTAKISLSSSPSPQPTKTIVTDTVTKASAVDTTTLAVTSSSLAR